MTPRFPVRDLLVLLSVEAIACFALVKPSSFWLLSSPVLAAVLTVSGFYRATTSRECRIFWAALGAGIVAYGLLVTFVTIQFADVYAYANGRTAWTTQLGEPLWNMLHPGEMIEVSFSSFVFTWHAVVALSVSTTAAYIMQFLVGRKRTSRPS